MDICGETLIGFVCAHGDTFEFLELAEEVFDQVAPLVDFRVDRQRRSAPWMLRDDSWAFAALAESGIEIDSSVFVSSRAHGGFAGFGSAEPCLIKHQGIVLKEFPVGTGRIIGRQIVFSGGGYFRLLPYFQIRQMLRQSTYAMTYFHPRDFDADQPRLPGLPWRRVFKSYVGLGSSFEKLKMLLKEFQFIDIKEADTAIDWPGRPVVEFA
jgi:peptidoglycan-N-acetylglucosamine deacetylase